MNTNPEHGTRLRFDLVGSDPEGADYRVTIYSPGGEQSLAARLSLVDGEVRLGSGGADAPAAVLRAVSPFAKQILSARRADPAGHWPRRVLRWRGERDG